MVCKKCPVNPVIILPNSNIKLCSSCFIKYFEKKVYKTIRQYNLLDKKDKIAVALSGGKDSLSLLYVLNKLATKQRDIDLLAILINEGIHGYRELTIKDAKAFCKKYNIDLKIYSYEQEFGYPLDTLIKKIHLNACTTCGVLRRYLLNKYARKLKVKKLATAHNLDDEAQAIMMNMFKNNVGISARLGPITGVVKDERFIPRIKPFYFLMEKETATYAYLKKLTSHFTECPNIAGSLRDNVRNLLNDFEERYPGTKHAVINSFLEISPLLKKHYSTKKRIQECKYCEEPCSQEICKTCQLLEKIKRPN